MPTKTKPTQERPPTGRWLEEFKCGCTNVTVTKREALGYCPVHGTDRRRITLVPKDIEEGYAD